MKQKQIQMKMSEGLEKKIVEFARENEMTRSTAIRFALKHFLEGDMK